MNKKSLEEYVADPSFVRWIRGESDAESEKYWSEWLENDPSNKWIAEEARVMILSFEQDEYRSLGEIQELQKFERLLDAEIQKEKFSRLSSSRKHYLLYRKSRIWAAAAVLAVTVLSGLAIMWEEDYFGGEQEKVNLSETINTQEYTTGEGERASFRLHDHSTIVLNANSHIRFTVVSDEETKRTEVWLEGEAWFDITHFEDQDLRRVFAVHTSDGTVEVLGTRFTVRTFENETRTVLETGQILVKRSAQAKAESDDKNSNIYLNPGEKAVISADKNEIYVERVNPWIYMSWGEDVWTFEDTYVKEIALRIEEAFGLEVQVKQELAERRLSGSIRSTNIYLIKEALAKILGVKIEKQDNTLIVGTDEAN